MIRRECSAAGTSTSAAVRLLRIERALANSAWASASVPAWTAAHRSFSTLAEPEVMARGAEQVVVLQCKGGDLQVERRQLQFVVLALPCGVVRLAGFSGECVD
jgi:hypothetical protein